MLSVRPSVRLCTLFWGVPIGIRQPTHGMFIIILLKEGQAPEGPWRRTRGPIARKTLGEKKEEQEQASSAASYRSDMEPAA